MTEPKNATVVPLRREDIDHDALRERLRNVIANERIPQTRLAREAGDGVSAATLSQYLNGSYRGDNAAVAAKLLRWLTAWEDRQAQGGLPEAPEWIETPSALRVMDGLRYTKMAQDVTVIYGGAGTGKTNAIERYAQMVPNVFHVTMDPTCRTVMGCLDRMCIGMGLRDYVRTASGMRSAVAARMRNTNGLLIVDEAQNVNLEALDLLRSFHDELHIGLALVGNETVYTRMTSGNRARMLDRLFSRVGRRMFLKGAVAGDIEATIKAWGIEAGCAQLVREIASKPGALRVLTKVLRLAAFYAKAAERKLCCEDIKSAWNELGAVE